MAQARADSPGRTKLAQALQASWKALLAGAALASVLLFALAKPLMLFLYGDAFASSADVLRILACILMPFTINTYLTLSLLAWNKEKLIGRALAAGLLGLLILNRWWIPLAGAQGGAWAALCAECLQSAVLLTSAPWPFPIKGEMHDLSNLS
jgi:O-antigen/teichoic acid export membrane protein